jgi:threonine dehydrogenase-like Zn-dependent dehydrogenase
MKPSSLKNCVSPKFRSRWRSCNHRKYLPKLVEMVRSGSINPASILTQVQPPTNVIDAYKAFDARQEGWIKVELLPAGMTGAAA